MARHAWINVARLKRGRATRVVDGVEIIVEVSPYSIPKAVVGTYDETKQVFRIDFKYIDDEVAASKPRQIDEVFIREGKYSRKILGIDIPLENPALRGISLITLSTKIKKAFKGRIEGVLDFDAPDAPDDLNQEVAEEVLSDRMLEALTGDLVRTGR